MNTGLKFVQFLQNLLGFWHPDPEQEEAQAQQEHGNRQNLNGGAEAQPVDELAEAGVERHVKQGGETSDKAGGGAGKPRVVVSADSSTMVGQRMENASPEPHSSSMPRRSSSMPETYSTPAAATNTRMLRIMPHFCTRGANSSRPAMMPPKKKDRYRAAWGTV